MKKTSVLHSTGMWGGACGCHCVPSALIVGEVPRSTTTKRIELAFGLVTPCSGRMRWVSDDHLPVLDRAVRLSLQLCNLSCDSPAAAETFCSSRQWTGGG